MAEQKENPPSDLTDKQKQFCIEYLVDFNASRAARDTGTPEDSAGAVGCELLKNPKVHQFISKCVRDRFNSAEVTVDYVLKNLMALHDRCCGLVPVRTNDGKGMRYVWNAKGAAKALELLGKYMKMYTDNINLGATNSLAAIMKELAQKNATPGK